MARWRIAVAAGAVAVLSVSGFLFLDDDPDAPDRNGDESWTGLVEPTLAADDAGGQILFARRTAPDLAAQERFGRVLVARSAPGSDRWTGFEPLSSQDDTAGLAADAAGHGNAIVAWTAGGVAWTRSLGAGGSWTPEERISTGTGVRFVSADVNRAGDELVAWREGERVALAWREAGGEWRRWRGPVTSQRPAAALSERRDGTATARVVWLQGAGEGTTIRLHAESFGADPGSFDRDLLRAPNLRSFGWDAGAERQTLAAVARTSGSGGSATTSAVTTYDGLFGEALEPRWSAADASPNPAPVIDMTGGAVRVAWVSYTLSPDGLDSVGALWTRAGQDGVWGRPTRLARSVPNATLRAIATRIDASGAGLLGYRTDDGTGATSGTVLRVPGKARTLQLRMVPTRGPVAFGVGLRGPIAVAWATGTVEDPVLRARLLTR